MTWLTIVIPSIYKAQSLVHRDYSKRMHAHTQARVHTSIQAIQNSYTKLAAIRNETNKHSSTERKIWQIYGVGERNVEVFPESFQTVSGGEEGEGHSMLRDRIHTRRGNQQ